MGGGCPLCADVRLGMWGRARSHGRQYKGNGKVLQVDKVGDIININHTFLSRFDLISGKPSTIATLPLMYQVFRNPQQIPRRSFAAKLSYFSARISAGKQLFRNPKKIDTQGRTKPTTSTPCSSVRSRSLPPGTLLPTELAPAVKTCCRIFARVSNTKTDVISASFFSIFVPLQQIDINTNTSGPDRLEVEPFRNCTQLRRQCRSQNT